MNKIHTMRDLVQRYLKQKRALGYIFRFYDGPLLDFARFADTTAPGRPITTALGVQWASQSNAAPSYQAKRLSMIRNLAQFCAAFDPHTEVPPHGLLGPSTSRIQPHIYSSAQLRSLLRQARHLSPVFSPLRPCAYETIFGLLAVTGLRRSEVLRLRLSDFDEVAGTLRIARSKFCPERVLPLHSSTVRALKRYLHRRQSLLPLGEHLFVGHHGQPIPAGTLQQTFRLLTRDWRSNGARRRPRLHDFRHTFATHHIAQWSRRSSTLAHRLLLLSRYLGHRHFHDTWWYVSADAQALQAAAQRFARFQHGRSSLDS